MFRVTTNGTLRTYRGNLAKASWNQYYAMNTVLTGRRFNSFSEDPALAAQSFRVHAASARNEFQRKTSESAIHKFESAQASLQEIADQYNTALDQAEQGVDGSKSSAREEIGKTLLNTAEGMVKTLNAKYGDKFVFAGANGEEAPFELKDGKLYFRGIDMATQDPDELAKLEEWSKESTYVDIGLGLQLDENEQVIPSTAFNTAISGAGLLGFGTYEDGSPKDIISLTAQLGQLLVDSAADGSDKMNEADQEKANALFDKMQESYSAFNPNRAELDTKAQFLKSNDTRLTSTGDTLTEQYESLDRVDLADALSTFVYAQYSYNAALRVGNNVLSQSFIDYMS